MCKALQRALHSACSVISSNFGCAFLEYQMFKYRGITLAYLFVPFYISFTFKIFQTLHYFIFPFATRKLHYKRHILNFVILLWSDRYLVSVLISQKTPHAATAFNHTFVTLQDLYFKEDTKTNYNIAIPRDVEVTRSWRWWVVHSGHWDGSGGHLNFTHSYIILILHHADLLFCASGLWIVEIFEHNILHISKTQQCFHYKTHISFTIL